MIIKKVSILIKQKFYKEVCRQLEKDHLITFIEIDEPFFDKTGHLLIYSSRGKSAYFDDNHINQTMAIDVMKKIGPQIFKEMK